MTRRVPYLFFDNVVDVNVIYPHPTPMKRNNHCMYGETPFVSYPVYVNHVVEKVVSSTASDQAPSWGVHERLFCVPRVVGVSISVSMSFVGCCSATGGGGCCLSLSRAGWAPAAHSVRGPSHLDVAQRRFLATVAPWFRQPS